MTPENEASMNLAAEAEKSLCNVSKMYCHLKPILAQSIRRLVASEEALRAERDALQARVVEMEHSLDEIQCALDDEESSAQETLSMLQVAQARVAELEGACRLAAHELRFMLNAFPERRGGLYEKALAACEAALASSPAPAASSEPVYEPMQHDGSYWWVCHDKEEVWDVEPDTFLELVYTNGTFVEGDECPDSARYTTKADALADLEQARQRAEAKS